MKYNYCQFCILMYVKSRLCSYSYNFRDANFVLPHNSNFVDKIRVEVRICFVAHAVVIDNYTECKWECESMHGNIASQHWSSRIGLHHRRRRRSWVGRLETVRTMKRSRCSSSVTSVCNMIQSSCSIELWVIQRTISFRVCCVNASMHASNYT